MHSRAQEDGRTPRRPVPRKGGPFGMAVGLLATACVLTAAGCSRAPAVPDGDAAPDPNTARGADAVPDADTAHGADAVPDADTAPEGDSVPEETRREVRQLWGKFRGLLLKDERDSGAYKGLVDEPDGFAHLERCLAAGVNLRVEWLRMTSEDLKRASARFRFFLDREECEVYFTGLEEGASRDLLLRLVDGRWVIWPQRG